MFYQDSAHSKVTKGRTVHAKWTAIYCVHNSTHVHDCFTHQPIKIVYTWSTIIPTIHISNSQLIESETLKKCMKFVLNTYNFTILKTSNIYIYKSSDQLTSDLFVYYRIRSQLVDMYNIKKSTFIIVFFINAVTLIYNSVSSRRLIRMEIIS